jgi:hypothetical protein
VKGTFAALEFVGSYVGGKLLDWAIGQGIVIFAGSEQERATRRIFEEAAVGALLEVYNESDGPADDESAKALAEHLATGLTNPSIAAMLLRAANTNTTPDAGAVVERMERSGFDTTLVPFSIGSFVTALVPKLGEGIGQEVRAKGLAETVFADKLDELLDRTEPRESAIRAANSGADGLRRHPVLVGVRSFTRRAEDMDDEMDKLLRLEAHFEGRHIKAPELWREAVYPELETFLERNLNGHDRYLLHLNTHTSIAFACGFLLDPKSGVDVVPVQRTSGRREWSPELDLSEVRSDLPEELWKLCRVPLNEGGRDLVAAVSVTHDILEDVEAYARKRIPTASRILHFKVVPKVGWHSVRDGAHALFLAEELLARVREARTPDERTGTLHLFAAAPAGLVFFAGRLSRGLGRCALYEFDFEGDALGAYELSLMLPQPPTSSAAATETRGG